MAFTDKLKAKAAELDLQTKAAQAKEKAASLAEANRGKVAGAVDKVGQTVDSKTGGKYSDKIIKAQDAALKGVDKVAAQGSATGTAGKHTQTDRVDAAVGSDATPSAGTVTDETPVERAVGADAPTISLDPERNTEN